MSEPDEWYAVGGFPKPNLPFGVDSAREVQDTQLPDSPQTKELLASLDDLHRDMQQQEEFLINDLAEAVYWACRYYGNPNESDDRWVTKQRGQSVLRHLTLRGYKVMKRRTND